MGDTNPENADNDTLRKLYGTTFSVMQFMVQIAMKMQKKKLVFFSKLELLN